MVWAPTERFALLKEAEPAASIAEPICDEPSRNATVRVGVPFPDCGATPAVNVTFCPLVNWGADAESEVAVAVFAAAATVKGTAADVDAENLALPAYTAAPEMSSPESKRKRSRSRPEKCNSRRWRPPIRASRRQFASGSHYCRYRLRR